MNKKPNIMGQAGAILNLISGWILAIIGWVIFPIAIIAIFSIIRNNRYLKTGENQLSAGLLGIFTNIIGGIFVICAKPEVMVVATPQIVELPKQPQPKKQTKTTPK